MRLLAAFRRRWLLAVGLGMLAATVAGTAAWFLVPPAKFAAEAVLQVDSRVPVVVFSTAETQNQAQDEYKRYQKSQINLVRSRLVLVSALGQPGIDKFRTIREADDPVTWLKEHLEVSFINDSEILQIGLKGDYPEEMAAIVNAVREAYMEEVVNVERKRTERYDMLKELNAKKQETLAKQRQSVRTLAESLGSSNQQALVLKQQFAMESQAIIEKELLQIKSERRRAEAELSAQLKVVETVAEVPKIPSTNRPSRRSSAPTRRSSPSGSNSRRPRAGSGSRAPCSPRPLAAPGPTRRSSRSSPRRSGHKKS